MKRIAIYILAFALNVILASPATAADYLKNEHEYYNKGEYDAAISEYTKAIEINPHDEPVGKPWISPIITLGSSPN